jgi:hypothetical protein
VTLGRVAACNGASNRRKQQSRFTLLALDFCWQFAGEKPHWFGLFWDWNRWRSFDFVAALQLPLRLANACKVALAFGLFKLPFSKIARFLSVCSVLRATLERMQLARFNPRFYAIVALDADITRWQFKRRHDLLLHRWKGEAFGFYDICQSRTATLARPFLAVEAQ